MEVLVLEFEEMEITVGVMTLKPLKFVENATIN
jgi:hypothetical protein